MDYKYVPFHHQDQILGERHNGNKTKSFVRDKAIMALVSWVKPKKIEEALIDKCYILTMVEELNQFTINDVYTLVPPPIY